MSYLLEVTNLVSSVNKVSNFAEGVNSSGYNNSLQVDPENTSSPGLLFTCKDSPVRADWSIFSGSSSNRRASAGTISPTPSLMLIADYVSWYQNFSFLFIPFPVSKDLQNPLIPHPIFTYYIYIYNTTN